MAIKKIKVKNFKSFKDLEVELGNFNVLIGANASGKSNFVQIFKFLRDIMISGLENAVSMAGDIEYLRNLNIRSANNIKIEVNIDTDFGILLKENDEGLFGFKTIESIYEFALKMLNNDYKIYEEKSIQKCEFVKLTSKKDLKGNIIGKGTIDIIRKNGNLDVKLKSSENVPIAKQDIIPTSYKKKELSNKNLFIKEPIISSFLLRRFFEDISIYNFDPNLPKKATPITGKAELEEDGNNLSIIIKNILSDNKRKRKIINLIKDVLDFVVDIGVEKFADKQLLMKFCETYTEDQYLPAFLMSDGTINITSLIIALYFEKKPIAIFEEPERNIHPYLISKVIDMMKDASKNKQIIISTHNPEIVKYAGIDNILLVSRDKDGFSTITRPVEKDEIKIFLENEMGIEELYVQNLLEI